MTISLLLSFNNFKKHYEMLKYFFFYSQMEGKDLPLEGSTEEAEGEVSEDEIHEGYAIKPGIVFYFYQIVIIPPLTGGGRGIYCFTSVSPSVHPRYFSSHFTQQLLMAEILYLVTSFK